MTEEKYYRENMENAPAAESEAAAESAVEAEAAAEAVGEAAVEAVEETVTSADPLAREQIVNHTRNFSDEAPVLSPWAAATGADATGAAATAAGAVNTPEKVDTPAAVGSQAVSELYTDGQAGDTIDIEDMTSGPEEPAVKQVFDPYARPNRYGRTVGQTYAYGQGAAQQSYTYGQSAAQQPASGLVYGKAPEPRTASGGAGGFNGGTGGGNPAGKEKKHRDARYITRRGFIIGMICCMLATSGATIGGLSLAGAFDRTAASAAGGEDKVVSATNYTLAEATGNEKSIEEIVAMNENAVVEIVTESVVTDTWLQSYVTQGAGSGIIIDSRGYIMTNNHVIANARNITVTLKSGEQYSAVLVGADPENDVAVIKIEGDGFVAATYGNSDDLSVGDLAVAIGNPLGQLGGTVTTGIISALDRELTIDGKALTLLQTDASINPGNSGGGLFDGEGNLIGLVVAKSGGSNVEGLGFAIPINIAAPIAKDLIEAWNPGSNALIGITVINVDSEEMAKNYGFSSIGVYINEVTSPEARKAGIQSGDQISMVGDDVITDYDSLTAALAKHAPGDTVTVTVIRDGEPVEVETTLIAGN